MDPRTFILFQFSVRSRGSVTEMMEEKLRSQQQRLEERLTAGRDATLVRTDTALVINGPSMSISRWAGGSPTKQEKPHVVSGFPRNSGTDTLREAIGSSGPITSQGSSIRPNLKYVDDYCKFGNFRESFILVKLHIYNVS